MAGMTEAQDAAMDKKMSIKEDSPADVAEDKKMGVKQKKLGRRARMAKAIRGMN